MIEQVLLPWRSSVGIPCRIAHWQPRGPVQSYSHLYVFLQVGLHEVKGLSASPLLAACSSP